MDRRHFLGALSLLGCMPARAAERSCTVTKRDLLGPFHLEGAPKRTVLAAKDERGTRLLLSGRVRDEACRPITKALLDLWQADANGQYHDARDDFRLRGQVSSDADGMWAVETIVPGRYRLEGGLRPAHIHFNVSAPEHKPLTTQLYFAGDPHLGDDDACGDACDSHDQDRMVQLVKSHVGMLTAHFDIVLAKSR